MTTTEAAPLAPLAFAGKLRVHLEKIRVATQVRLAHLERLGQRDALSEELLPKLEALEELVESRIEDACKAHPVYAWVERVKGAGAMSVGAIMARADITRLNTVSSMWAHFGFAPGQKRVKGEKVAFDVTGKTWCWRLGDSLLKRSGTKFRAVYDRRKEYEQARYAAQGIRIIPATRTKKEGEVYEGQVHMRAMRYMIKTFLACLWKQWREAEGLPVAPPYIIGRVDANGKQHSTEYLPEEFCDRPA